MVSTRERTTTIFVYTTLANAQAKTNGTQYTGPIVEGSCRYEHVYITAFPGFGECNAAMFRAEIGANTDLTGKYIAVKYTYYEADNSANATEKWLFTGRVVSCRYDEEKATRTLEAYDQFYDLRTADASSWWASYWQSAVFVSWSSFINAICTQWNIPRGTLTLGDQQINVTAQRNNPITGCTVAQLLSLLAQVAGVFLYFDGNGSLQKGSLAMETAADISDNIDNGETMIADGDLAQFGTLLVYDGNAVTYTGGSGEPTYSISDNPLLYGINTAELPTYLSGTLAILQAIQQRPASLRLIVSDPRVIDAGQRVTSGENRAHFVTGVEMSGAQMIECLLTCTAEQNAAAGYDPAVISMANNVQALGVQMTFKVNADSVIEAVNLEAQNAVTINAEALNINGIISANGTFKIDTAGNVTATGGKIGGWEIGANYLRRIITLGQYDYQVILYAPDSPIATTGAVAIQRRAAGTSDAWSSVTRMTYGGGLITNSLTADGGTVGGWTIGAASLERSAEIAGVLHKAGLYAPSTLTADAAAVKVQRGSGNDRDEISVKYDGKIEATNKINAETTNTIGISGAGFETKSEYHDYTETDQNRRGYATLNGSSFALQNAKRGSVGEVNERPAYEAIVEATEIGATVDIMAHTGTDDEAEASLDVSAGFASLYLGDGTNYSRLASDGLTVKGVDYFTPETGSGTRNTTNTSSGTLNYYKIGRVVVVVMTGTAPAVTTANAVLFSGLPAAIDNISFPAVPTTARGAARFYVDTAGNIKIGGNATAAQTYLANFTYIAAV